MLFQGSCVALVTPFTKDGIDFDAYKKLIEFHLNANTDAILVCGTTGEPATMTSEEQTKSVEFVVKEVGGKIPVIAGIGGNNTAACIEKAKIYADKGADAFLSVTPYYNKCSKKGLLLHFEAIADASEKPVVLYNVPSRTSVNITPEAAAHLCEHENIIAIKEASGDLDQVEKTAELTKGKMAVYSGNDDQTVDILKRGGKGVISVLANVAPKYTHDMVMAYLNGDVKKAEKMQAAADSLIKALFCEVNPIPVKTAVNLMGMNAGIYRLPLCEPEDEHKEYIISEMKAFSLI